MRRLLLVLAAVLVAGCGDDGGSSSAVTVTQTVAAAASPPEPAPPGAPNLRVLEPEVVFGDPVRVEVDRGGVSRRLAVEVQAEGCERANGAEDVPPGRAASVVALTGVAVGAGEVCLVDPAVPRGEGVLASAPVTVRPMRARLRVQAPPTARPWRPFTIRMTGTVERPASLVVWRGFREDCGDWQRVDPGMVLAQFSVRGDFDQTAPVRLPPGQARQRCVSVGATDDDRSVTRAFRVVVRHREAAAGP